MKPVSAAVARVVRSTTFIAVLAFLAGGMIPPAATHVQAQTITDGLVGLLNTQTLQPGDVVKDQQAALITTQTVARAVSIELATIPVTSSAGGFGIGSFEGGRFAVHANVTFRPTSGGLSGHVVPGIALDYSFGS